MGSGNHNVSGEEFIGLAGENPARIKAGSRGGATIQVVTKENAEVFRNWRVTLAEPLIIVEGSVPVPRPAEKDATAMADESLVP